MRIVVLTGAGISAESGVPTFRDADGLWEGHRVEDVATPEAFERQPAVVHRFYDARRAALAAVEPNPAHHALARLEAALGEDLLVVTQNIDDLHERAGSTRIAAHARRAALGAVPGCGTRVSSGRATWATPAVPAAADGLRPDVVWFGEIPYDLDRIFVALEAADLFVSIGTSGAVYPAAGFVQAAAAYGARTLELNLVPSDGQPPLRRGPARPAPVRSCRPGSTRCWREQPARLR